MNFFASERPIKILFLKKKINNKKNFNFFFNLREILSQTNLLHKEIFISIEVSEENSSD